MTISTYRWFGKVEGMNQFVYGSCDAISAKDDSVVVSTVCRAANDFSVKQNIVEQSRGMLLTVYPEY